MDIPQVNIQRATSKAASWQNKVTKYANENAFGQSKGVLVHQTSDGTILKQLRQDTINPLLWNYTSEFNQTASYSVNDIVTILPNVSYGVSASVGCFICVAPVPDSNLSTVLISTYGSGSFPQWVRQPNAQYFPQFPYSSSIATVEAPVGRYFEMIGTLTTGSTGGMNYKGTYNTAISYSAGDVTRVQSGTSQGVWICSATSSIVGIPPVFPEPLSVGSGSQQWDMFVFGVQQTNNCVSGINSIVYINSNTSF